MYKQSKEQRKRIEEIYGHIDDMVVLRSQQQKYFNDRTLIEFLDDNEKRWNSYTPSRDAQNKDWWQANFFHPTTRNKVKAVIAAYASSIPLINIKASNVNQKTDVKRADVMKNLVKQSYDVEDMVDTTQTQNFFEALEATSVGTAITHCTYENIIRDKKTITSYDVASGEYEFESKKEVVRDQCTDEVVPLNEMYISSMMCKNGSIQAQSRISRIKYYTQDEFDDEFGEYKDAKHVETSNNLKSAEEQERFFYDTWSQRVKDSDGQIEVARVYSNIHDEYVIVANGVLLLDVPLLWEYKKEKVYPFAKTIFEPFATNFFYGNPLPNTLMGEQDVINSLYNMMVDKTYRAFNKQLMIGEQNRDAFDMDEQSAQDSIIYVSSVNEAREVPQEGVTAGEFNMINLMSRGLDASSVDKNQSGMTGSRSTAREVLLADENARKLGGIFRMFMSNHWKQKNILRIVNILRFYTQDKVDLSLGIENPQVESRVFTVEDTELSNGQQGTLNIEMIPEGQPLPTRQELDAQEIEAEKDGKNVEFMALKATYISDWYYDITVIEDSIENQNESIKQAKIEKKLMTMAKIFPQLFMLNQNKFFKETLQSYGDDPAQYETKMPQLPQQPTEEQGEQAQPTPAPTQK